jgi:hypothetical protein
LRPRVLPTVIVLLGTAEMPSMVHAAFAHGKSLSMPLPISNVLLAWIWNTPDLISLVARKAFKKNVAAIETMALTLHKTARTVTLA